jgi:hypothetical protein
VISSGEGLVDSKNDIFVGRDDALVLFGASAC